MTATIDGNEAVARVAFKLNEIIIIYPITPASLMGELSDLYASQDQKNIFDTVPKIMEMQSEAGASGAVHGALQTGTLTTTFTASQGLLLMIPNMYKIAGELTPTVFHVAARSIATQALSIFGDHTDVMTVRPTGFAMLCSNSVQEAQDFALIAQVASLRSRVPFLHFFDGFRTSHEVSKIELLDDSILKAMMDTTLVSSHRERALTPDHPFIRGTSQNPDVYFQGRESVNAYYEKTPHIVKETMQTFAKLTGRNYEIVEYVGAYDAQHIIVIMGSGAETVEEVVHYLNTQKESVGVIKIRLYRPFPKQSFIDALPKTVRSIAVLDRTKEAGSLGEPLYLDIVGAISEAHEEKTLPCALPQIIGGRYGLASKEFTPAMVKAIFDELKAKEPKRHFTIGIFDDVTHSSLSFDRDFSLPREDTFEAIFFGLGSDGTVGANKNSIKIIGAETDHYAQGYFVYDSKKSGSMTTSHLRFGPRPIHSTYLIEKADFVACHQSVFLEKFDILQHAKQGAIFLLNTPLNQDEIWDRLPRTIQEELIAKEIRMYVIDAYKIAKEHQLARRINTIMQTCFFAITKILPLDDALRQIKASIKESYGHKRGELVDLNIKAVEDTLGQLQIVTIPKSAQSLYRIKAPVKADVSDFVANVTAHLIAGEGDELPVSMMPADGTWPSGTTQYEKRNIAQEIPVWEQDLCIQCNKCVLVCPHSVIRSKVIDKAMLKDAPGTFKSVAAQGKSFNEHEYFTIEVALEDCTGCTLCVEVCPAKDHELPERKALNMSPKAAFMEEGQKNWDFFLTLPEYDRSKLDHHKVKESQFLQPLFEFSGACPGCGETPYLKLATQLFGDRMIIANATGCSSIYGGNLPTTPWAKNLQGRGPAWSNSLFEDNAEFGLGFRLSIDKHEEEAKELLEKLADTLDTELVTGIQTCDQHEEIEIFTQRKRIEHLKELLQSDPSSQAQQLAELADYLVKKSVWIIGGDGWAYDIGYGGLDHVLASGKNVNILVLDTQVYSNTGGQQSKATPTGAVAKFASGGKAQHPKDLAMMALAYDDVYVARVAMGASDTQTLKAFMEAESYDGPSLIIAYAHCIAHGYDLKNGMHQQKLAVECGLWPLFRYDPRLKAKGENPMKLDYKAPKIPVEAYMYNEARFKMAVSADPKDAQVFLKTANAYAHEMYARYENLAKLGEEEALASK